MAAIDIAIIGVMTAGVAVAILGERQQKPWSGIGKMAAATGYLILAWRGGAIATEFGGIIMVALLMSWLGDLLLIPKDKRAFIAGLASFLLAHVAFAGAFWYLRPDPVIVLLALAAFAAGFVPLMGRWLMPRVPRKMKGPVTAYIGAILLMLATAFGASETTGNWWIAGAAFVFAISDLFVARQRFIVRHWHNRAIGLPLYFAAQVVFALLVAG